MNARHFTTEAMGEAQAAPVPQAAQAAPVPQAASVPQVAPVAPATQVPADQVNFKRYELKYLITPAQRAALDALIAANLVPDEHGRSLVTSVYYDTPSDLLMRRSIEGGPYKEKLRVRTYGRLTADSRVFVEIKKKCDGVVYKRRVSASPEGARRSLATGMPVEQSQIGREIAGLVSRYPGIEPAMLVSYERCAYHTPSESGVVLGGGDATGELRLTVDENIRWLDREDGDVWFDRAGEGRELLPEGYALMEAKCAGALPLWFVEFLSANAIRAQSFSKCGNAYRWRMAARQAERAAVPVAAPAVVPASSRMAWRPGRPVRATTPLTSVLATPRVFA